MHPRLVLNSWPASSTFPAQEWQVCPTHPDLPCAGDGIRVSCLPGQCATAGLSLAFGFFRLSISSGWPRTVCGWGWPWTELPASTSWVPRLYFRAKRPNFILCWSWNPRPHTWKARALRSHVLSVTLSAYAFKVLFWEGWCWPQYVSLKFCVELQVAFWQLTVQLISGDIFYSLRSHRRCLNADS